MFSVLAGGLPTWRRTSDRLGQQAAVPDLKQALGRRPDKATGRISRKRKGEAARETLPQAVQGIERLPWAIPKQFDTARQHNLFIGTLLDRFGRTLNSIGIYL